MAENQNTITTVFKADISNFSKSTQDLNRYIGTVNSEFKRATAGLDDWRKSQDGLTAKITQLNNVLEAEKRKLGNLEGAYAELVAAGKENTAEAQKLATKINNQSAVVSRTENSIKKYNNSLEDLKKAGVKAGDSIENVNKKLKENQKESTSAADKFKGFAKGLAGIGAAAVAAAGSFVALAESTREVRTQLAKLEVNANRSGVSIETSNKAMKELAAVGADTDQSLEAVSNLLMAGFDDNSMAGAIEQISNAVVAFPSTLSVEGLSDSLQESMSVMNSGNNATGQYAELLERLGYNLDDVTAHYGTLGTEQEKQSYLLGLVEDGLGGTADAYKENNKDLVEAAEAQYDLTQATADLGAAAEPLSTILKGLGASILTGILPYIKELASALQTLFSGDIAGSAEQFGGIFDGLLSKIAETISSIITKIGELLPQILPKIVEMLSGFVQTIVSYLPMLVEAATTLFMGIVQAIPPVIIALLAELPKIVDTVLSALSNAIPLILDAAQQAFMSIVAALPAVLQALIAALPKILQSIIDFLVGSMPKLLQQAIAFLMQIVKAIPSIVSALAQNLPKIITTILNTLVSNIPKIISAAVSMFMGIITAIPKIIVELIKNLPQIIVSIVKGLADGTKELFKVGVNMMKGLWDGIKSMFSNIGKGIKNFFQNTVVGGIKKLLGIHSPSTVFAGIGKNSAEGYLDGFARTMDGANSTLARVNYAGAVGVEGGNGSPVQKVGGNTYNVYQTFEKMETTRYAMHRAKLETVNAMRLTRG